MSSLSRLGRRMQQQRWKIPYSGKDSEAVRMLERKSYAGVAVRMNGYTLSFDAQRQLLLDSRS